MHGPTVHDDIQRVLFSEEQIAQRVLELGRQITADYADAVARGEEIELVCLLRGSSIFMADLARAIKLPVRMDFMCVSSYGNGVHSSGMVRIQKDLADDVAGRHVIIVEDVIDSGLTLKFISKNLESRGPRSLEIAALVRKDLQDQADISCKYQGFACGDDFIVGYGLDFAERYRNLSEVCILDPKVYA